MQRIEKVKVVEELKKQLSNSKSIFLTDFTGLTVEEITRLRKEFREKRITFKVAKNTLMRLAAKESGREEILPYIEGPTGLAFGYDDPIVPARILYAFYKKIEKPRIKAFILEGQLYRGQDVNKLATLPSKEALLSQILGTLNAPLTNLVFTLQVIIRQFVITLNAIAEKKQK